MRDGDGEDTDEIREEIFYFKMGKLRIKYY